MVYKSETGAVSSERKPGYDMLTLTLLRRAAQRMDLGQANGYAKHNWRKGITDKNYILERLNHAVEHLYKAIHEIDFDAPADDDNLAAVVVNCMMAMEYNPNYNQAESPSPRMVNKDNMSEIAQTQIIEAIPHLNVKDAQVMLDYFGRCVSDMLHAKPPR